MNITGMTDREGDCNRGCLISSKRKTNKLLLLRTLVE